MQDAYLSGTRQNVSWYASQAELHKILPGWSVYMSSNIFAKGSIPAVSEPCSIGCGTLTFNHSLYQSQFNATILIKHDVE